MQESAFDYLQINLNLIRGVNYLFECFWSRNTLPQKGLNYENIIHNGIFIENGSAMNSSSTL